MNNILRKIGAGYHQLNDDFLLKKVLQDVEPVNISSRDKLFIFGHRTNSYYLNLYTLVAHALSKKGYPSCFLFRDCMVDRYFPTMENMTEKIDLSNLLTIRSFEIGSYFPKLIIDGKEISNSLIEEVSKLKITDGTDRRLHYEWDIDFKNELAEVKDVNFFHLIENTLRTVYKRYNIDFRNKQVFMISKEMIKSCDLLLQYFFMLKKYSAEKNVKIRIDGWEGDYIPNGIFRVLCNSFSKDREIEYISLARGYGHYFGHHHHESNIAISNLTHSGMKNRLVVTNKELKSLAKRYDVDVTFSEINKIIKKPVIKGLKTKQQKIVDLIEEHKASGKNVFVLFTHLFYDTPIDDSSAAFEDMCDWILETIKFFKKKDDFLLLKPHPAEVRPDNPQLEPSETLSSFIKDNNVNLSDNILLLKPRLFGLNEIVSFIDCGLVWRSSVAIELPVYNVSSIIAGSPSYEILDFNYAKDKKDYFNMIENVKKLNVTKDLKLNAARYILALKNKHKYIQSIAHNKKIKRNYLEKRFLDRYLKYGDKNIDFLVNELLK